MDIFVYGTSGQNFDLNTAKFINNYDQLTWIERFSEPSDFVIEAPLDSSIQEDMPIGSLVSHIESDEVCVVEDHEIIIDEASDVTDIIRISGRSFETFLYERIIGSNKVWPAIAFPQSPYSISGGYACTQARKLIADHIDAQVLIDDNDSLPKVNIWLDPQVSPAYGYLAQPGESIFERIPLYEGAKQLLDLDGLGLNTRRPRPGVVLDDNRDSPSRYETGALTLCIYPGRDQTKRVSFSHAMGDIKQANYLFSSRSAKTSCLVYSRYFAVMVHGPQTGFSRRVMTLSATDLDEQYDSIPGFAINSKILQTMETRGRAALARRNAVSISNVAIEDKDLTHVYRQDYRLGDYVSVYGDYQASTVLQVTEHVEIQDKTGYSAYPTLSEPPLGGYYVPSQHVA